jgi:hypothetical protein
MRKRRLPFDERENRSKRPVLRQNSMHTDSRRDGCPIQVIPSPSNLSRRSARTVYQYIKDAGASFVSTSSIAFVVVPMLLVLVTAAARYIPPFAHRDPMVALRYE